MTNRPSHIGHAVRWSAIDALARYGLNFFVLIILARTLSPADFGLVAMFALFVSISVVLIDSGFSQAIIQRQQTTPTDESTIFFFTLLMGALIAIILCVSAPWIAAFYGQLPLFEEITYWMALNLFLNTLGSIHTTLLTKELDFRTITKAGVVATFVSGGVAVFMAVCGCGVWSLVGQSLASTITRVIFLWLLHSWRPQWVFSVASLRSFFNFGGFLLWTGLMNALYTNLYALLIGKLYSVQEVGFYFQAQRLQQLPVNVLTNVVGRVAFPVFAAAIDDKAKLVRGLRKGMTSVMFINVPLMLALMILAEPLVLTLFGLKWLPSVPVVQVLAVAGLLWPLHALNANVLKAQGRSDLNARIQLLKLTIAITLLLLASPYGILPIAYGEVAASLLAFFINAHYTRTLLGYGGFAQLRDVLPYFAASLPMVLSILWVEWMLKSAAQFKLFAAILIGGGVYLLVCKLAKLDVLENFISLIRRS